MRSSEKWPIWPVSTPRHKVKRGLLGFCGQCDQEHIRRKRERALSLQRARCIGEGLVRARARMERALAWLWRLGACPEGLAFVRRHASPEAAMLASAAANGDDGDHISWVIPHIGASARVRWGVLCSGALDPDRERVCGWPSVVAVTKEILASPEWAALPWQREAEVSRG